MFLASPAGFEPFESASPKPVAFRGLARIVKRNQWVNAICAMPFKAVWDRRNPPDSFLAWQRGGKKVWGDTGDAHP